MKRVFVCQDNVTGIFSALYDAWLECRKTGEAGVAVRGFLEQKLFCDYVESMSSAKKAAAVERMILKNLGETAARELYYAALSRDGEKGEAILGAMLAARKLRDSRRIMEQLQEPHVARVFELSRNVKNETHSFLEFIRFRELESRILLARIRPKNQVLSCIAPHFADRLPLENWMILDETWHMAAVHEKQKQWVLVRDVPDFPGGQLKFSAQEEDMTRLWQGFCRSIAIEERRNEKLQRTHLPLWYREHMVEFFPA